jgi:hypothetical protein
MRRISLVLVAVIAAGCGGSATVFEPPATGAVTESDAASVVRPGVTEDMTAIDLVACTTDARVGPNGEVYVRDRGKMCAWVDAQGNVVP